MTDLEPAQKTGPPRGVARPGGACGGQGFENKPLRPGGTLGQVVPCAG